MAVTEAIEELKKYSSDTEVSELKLEFVKGAKSDPIQAAKLFLEGNGYLVYRAGPQAALNPMP